jgi:Ca2+/Na+ antiporter
MFPSIEPGEVGTTGLIWLFLSYGYVLYFASNLISEGSDLLMLVPSMAGLVGGVVLPLLGAVPDGAIMLFSGLGDIESAQETLSVGVGALAGSTIMLLTVPWALSIFGGRVDLDEHGTPKYLGKPKLTPKHNKMDELYKTGVSLMEAVKHGAIIMAITTIPYFLIQVPAFYLHGPSEEIAEGEHWWSLAGLIVCVSGFVIYLGMQFRLSQKGMDKGARIAVVKKLLQKGEVSLAGALAPQVKAVEGKAAQSLAAQAAKEYQAVSDSEISIQPPPAVADYLKEVLLEAFMKYDENRDGTLDKSEVRLFFQDFHEELTSEDIDDLFEKFDTDNSGSISFDEFIGACYVFIQKHTELTKEEQRAKRQGRPTYEQAKSRRGTMHEALVGNMFKDNPEEEEEIPEELVDLDPDAQQAAIKKKAFAMLFIGTSLVIIFSDPMVDVMQQIAVELHMSPFYVSFILAPLASNASEVIASQYYAAKKTRKTITVSLTALEGAASMNNTFCLSIFMGLIFVRGLAWQYSAETIAIVVVEFLMAVVAQKDVLTTFHAALILSIFPLSIALVATLEAFGLD